MLRQTTDAPEIMCACCGCVNMQIVALAMFGHCCTTKCDPRAVPLPNLTFSSDLAGEGPRQVFPQITIVLGFALNLFECAVGSDELAHDDPFVEARITLERVRLCSAAGALDSRSALIQQHRRRLILPALAPRELSDQVPCLRPCRPRPSRRRRAFRRCDSAKWSARSLARILRRCRGQVNESRGVGRSSRRLLA